MKTLGIFIIVSIVLIFGFQNCGSRASFADNPAPAVEATDNSSIEEQKVKCPLAIAGSTSTKWGESIRFTATFMQNPDGIKATWHGSNKNVGTGNIEVEIEAQPAELVKLDDSSAALEVTDWKNDNINFVGSYKRYLEYKRGDVLVCRSNIVNAVWLSEAESKNK